MGDRGNICMNMEDGNKVYLYTHWGGHGLPETLKAALIRGEERWNDEQYLTRIIFNEMTKGREMELTGFGISTYKCDNEHDILHVSVKDQSVSIGTRQRLSFKEFISAEEIDFS